MTVKYEFLSSKLGRRIFGVFICCSLIPIVVFSVLSFNQVMENLQEQGQRRLQQSTKAVGMSILERLLLLNSEMRLAELNVRSGVATAVALQERVDDDMIAMRFSGMVIVKRDGGCDQLFGVIESPPAITPQERTSLVDGKTGIVTRSGSPGARVFMVRLLKPMAQDSDLLVAEVNTSRLWTIGAENALPRMTDLCVLDQSRKVIISSIARPEEMLAGLSMTTQLLDKRYFEWGREGSEDLAAYWTIFMKGGFAADNWTIVLSQSKWDILAPLHDFKTIFSLVTILTLLLVAFLSMYFIRRTLVPLEAVREGIQQISERRFDTRISVTSGDEFEEVAATFNEMSAQLGRQFKALTTMAQIDREILSSLDTERIITTALTGMQSYFSSILISIVLLDSTQANRAITYGAETELDRSSSACDVALRPEELQLLLDNREYVVVQNPRDFPSYVKDFNVRGLKSCLLLPVFVKNRLAAAISMGYLSSGLPPEDDLVHARQLANQMAVAMANSSLMDELEQLNWGTLKALARTVDAKSSWTAGHSERVSELAIETARCLGLSEGELADLHRGAFLHDIGKVGISNSILDKPGKLTTEEYELVKRHPVIGARILEPIAAYRNLIPIVLQHHERYDGNGYPHGLKGDAIHLGARILSAADVFDAMLSNRPYRNGLDFAYVIDSVRNGAGRQFDPQVVEALLVAIEKNELVILTSRHMKDGKVSS